MTITEIEPVESTLPAVQEAMAPAVYQRLPNNILADGLSTGDHKVIGRLWIFGSLLFGLFTLVADILVRIERLNTDSVSLFTANTPAFEQWFQLHRVSLVFLFVVPLLIGIAMVVVPLQLGSPSVAFPRAAAAAFWSWAVAGVIMLASWAIDGGLVTREGPVSQASQLSMVSLAGVVLAILIASMVIFTTIFTERSQGMSLYNVPLFTWSMLVATGVWLLSLPVLFSNLIVMWVDARGEAAQFFGQDNLYQQISWVFDQPQVFAFAIPVLGMLGETFPVAVGRRLKQYDLAMIAIGAFGAFSFGAYAQTFFNPGANSTWLYVVGSLALLLPVLGLLGAVGLTAKAAAKAPAMSAHLALSIMALLALLTAGAVATIRVADSFLAPIIGFLNGVVGFVQNVFDRSSDSGDGWGWLEDFQGWLNDNLSELPGTSVAGAMLQLALVAGLLAGLAGLFYWAPKILGNKLPTGLGMLAGLSLLGGAMVSAIPDAISGFLDQPEFVAAAPQRDGVEVLNLVSLIGSFGVVAGLGLVLLALPAAFLSGDEDEDEDEDTNNPWGGHTLEWLTESPPPPGNFTGPFVVTSEAPLLDDDFENPYAEGVSA